MQGSFGHYSFSACVGGLAIRGAPWGFRRKGARWIVRAQRFVAASRDPSLRSGREADGGVRPYTSYLLPRRRILEVKARPWQEVNVGSGWAESITLLTV